MFEKDTVIIDIQNTNVYEFIRQASIDHECGQNSYFYLYLSDVEEYKEDYPEHVSAIDKISEAMKSAKAKVCVCLVWW